MAQTMGGTPLQTQTGTAERRVVTALFCDVVGSTALAEGMDPEDWGDIVGRLVAVMAQSVERYGGTVTQFLGDAILALFGAPTAHEDDPYRAVRAGLDIIAAVRSSPSALAGVEVHVRVGINTGLVVVGAIDAGQLDVYSALGDVPNVAARLQSLAPPDTVLISEHTYRMAPNDLDVNELGPVQLKGRDLPVVVYEVVAARGDEDRRRGVAGLASPMVGRDQQLDDLAALVEVAAAGWTRVVAVIGEPGVGKSRLVEELGRKARERPAALWAVGQCIPYDDQRPFHLVASLVRSMAGVSSRDDGEVVRKAVDGLAGPSGVAGGQVMDHLLQLLGVSAVAPAEAPERLQAQYVDALAVLLDALGGDHRPIVLVCEDTHWADHSSVDLLSALLARSRTAPLLVLLVMRPDRDTAGWRLLSEARRLLGEALAEVHLDSLGATDSRDLVANLLAIESLPADLRQMVLDAAEGNPFFLEEAVRMLVEREVVELKDGRWVAAPGIEQIDVPPTVEGLLASRIDLLAPNARRAGRVAAVIGRQFSARLLDAVHAMVEGPDQVTPVIHPDLAELESHGIVRLVATRPDPEFAFRHALIRDVMYARLLKRERRALHEAVAAAIETIHAERLDDFAADLARHHAEGGQPDRAVGYALTAGRQALERGARQEAHRAFVRACDLLDEMPDAPPALRVDAALGRATSGSTFTPAPEAIAGLVSVLPLAQQLDDPDRLARLFTLLVSTRNMQGETYARPDYRRELDAAQALVPRLTDAGTKGLVQAMMGQAMHSADEFERAVPLLLAATNELEKAGRLSEASYSATALADAHATLGNVVAADAAIVRARSLGEASGDRNAIADAELIRGRIAAERGDLEEALDVTRQGLAAAEAAGNTFCLLAGNFFVADQQLRLGQPEEAIASLERSAELASYCNAGGYAALGRAWLAAAHARIGNVDAEAFTAPLESAIAAGSRTGEALVRRNRAVTLADSGQAERAIEDFERALELFEEIGARPNLARTHEAYGLALEALGRSDDAATHLREAEAIFSALGIRPDRAAT